MGFWWLFDGGVRVDVLVLIVGLWVVVIARLLGWGVRRSTAGVVGGGDFRWICDLAGCRLGYCWLLCGGLR